MSERRDYLTATDFYRYLQCPHWPYFERYATPEEYALKRQHTEVEFQLMENGLAHEKDVVRRLFADHRIEEVPNTFDAEQDFATTLELMKQGASLIYQGTLTYGDWTGRPDLLERREGESRFGSWYYVPVDVKSTHHLEKYQKLQLVFYALLLEKIQGRFPAQPEIVNRDGQRISFMAADMVREFESILIEIERIRAGERPDPVLRKSCYDTGPWGKACEHLARSTNDIALLFNVDVRRLKALRELGIRTTKDAAEMDVFAFENAAPGLRLHSLEVIKLQAQALINSWVIVREPVALPEAALEIHFDIESDPPNDVDYLYGILLRENGEERYLSFVAESLEEEGEMWRKFLAWLETLPESIVVYHFAPYELARLSVLEARYGGSQALDHFRAHMVDLKETVTSSVVFPLYFYGLKYIAPFLGFSWRGDVKGGVQSVAVFEKYLETKDRELLDSILTYNEDDVRATAHLKDWMVRYAKERTTYTPPYPWSA